MTTALLSYTTSGDTTIFFRFGLAGTVLGVILVCRLNQFERNVEHRSIRSIDCLTFAQREWIEEGPPPHQIVPDHKK